MIAHAVATSPADRDFFRKALQLEADWGLGRNPINTIEMGTATTPLSGKRSIQYMYTTGREDGVAGIHPGHTPYLNLDDWFCGMTMGCPSRLYQNTYPADFRNTWPIGGGLLQLALGVGALRVHPAADDAGQDGALRLPLRAGRRRGHRRPSRSPSARRERAAAR